MSVNCLRFKLALVAASALLVCCTFIFYFSLVDDPTRRLDSVDLSSYDLALFRDRLSKIKPSNASRPFSYPPSAASIQSHGLGIASHIFVLSLPRRVDRRTMMDSLSKALNIQFLYVNGVEAADVSVDRALHFLQMERHAFRNNNHNDNAPVFDFPDPDNELGDTDESFDYTVNPLEHPVLSTSLYSTPGSENLSESEEILSIPCATPEDPFPASLTTVELNLLPPWRVLSRGMIACWIGHLEIIRRVAKLKTDSVAIVLEDDVDMEFDICSRLVDMWPALPKNGWDIVMLGHCHSNERTHSPLPGTVSLRPSFAPKCTHAYAISHAGAMRLARILSTPGFAHSRALDQAVSWLIRTGRLRSYSIVPAIVVQSKRTNSDIWHPHPEIGDQSKANQLHDNKTLSYDRGSNWRDVLTDSTLERIEMLAKGG